MGEVYCIIKLDGVPKAWDVGWISGRAEEVGEVYGRDRARRGACRRDFNFMGIVYLHTRQSVLVDLKISKVEIFC